MSRRLFIVGLVLVLAGSYFAHAIQTAGGVTVQDVRFPADSGVIMSALLYTPRTATPEHRAPAVLLSHGYINTREMQSPFAIELARRGFVVLSMDMTGHGYSGGKVGSQKYGGPAALEFLRAFGNVDTLNIGLEAHSMGGGPILAAAAAMPNGYTSMVLEGSAPGVFGRSGAATTTFPRNVAIVFGRYDEFAPLMWQVPKGSEIGASKKLQALFGTTAIVSAGVPIGVADSGTARMLYQPAVTHPMEHFSHAGVGAAVDWFQKTLKGAASPRDPTDQIWMWKELGTLVAFGGFVLIMLGVFQLLISTPLFASLSQAAEPTVEHRAGRWWTTFVLTAALPALTFYPFMHAGSVVKPMRWLPQSVMNQLIVWALLNAVLTLIVGAVLRVRRSSTTATQWGKSLLIALASVGAGYLSLVLVDRLFTVDFRFWVVGLKPFDVRHFTIALVYLLPWTAFFLIALPSLNNGLAVKGESSRTQYATAALAMCVGFAVLLAVQYTTLFSTGLLFLPKEPLNTIIAIQFVPLLAIIGVIIAFTYRRTNSSVPGAFICALFITWYVAAGTAIQA